MAIHLSAPHSGDFNPRSPDGERRAARARFVPEAGISIHAPRMGSDPPADMAYITQSISIHAPRMGSDRHSQRTTIIDNDFNPRSPDGERPKQARTPQRNQVYFNPRSPDGERPSVFSLDCATSSISIHAPRMGSDQAHTAHPPHPTRISIHAPRMGSDRRPQYTKHCHSYFNPRSPDGERLATATLLFHHLEFQSTLPGWGATWQCRYGLAPHSIFQSTLPGWGATIPEVG